jgi:hypothetical protein
VVHRSTEGRVRDGRGAAPRRSNGDEDPAGYAPAVARQGRYRNGARGTILSDGNGVLPSAARWDTRVVYIAKRQRWWWNAWREATRTELYGFAVSREDATQDMYQAIQRAGPPS